jgi:hypothetical protein
MGRLPGCSSACWIACSYRHCRLRWRAVGWARAGTAAGGSVSAVLSKGLAPWRRLLLVRCPLGRRGGGSLAARGFAGLGDTGLSSARQLVSITADAHLVKWQSARTGPPEPRVKLVARPSRGSHWAATVLLTQFNRPLASSLAAGGVAVGCVLKQ